MPLEIFSDINPLIPVLFKLFLLSSLMVPKVHTRTQENYIQLGLSNFILNTECPSKYWRIPAKCIQPSFPEV
jgi:hypothetical protein